MRLLTLIEEAALCGAVRFIHQIIEIIAALQFRCFCCVRSILRLLLLDSFFLSYVVKNIIQHVVCIGFSAAIGCCCTLSRDR